MDGPFQNIADETTEQGDPQRHATRESIFLAAQLRIPPERVAVSARVRNISPGGMMVDFAAAATVGEPLIVEIKGVGPVAGKVAWVANGRIGIAFDREIDPQNTRVRGPDVSVDPRYQNHKPVLRRPGVVTR